MGWSIYFSKIFIIFFFLFFIRSSIVILKAGPRVSVPFWFDLSTRQQINENDWWTIPEMYKGETKTYVPKYKEINEHGLTSEKWQTTYVRKRKRKRTRLQWGLRRRINTKFLGVYKKRAKKVSSQQLVTAIATRRQLEKKSEIDPPNQKITKSENH